MKNRFFNPFLSFLIFLLTLHFTSIATADTDPNRISLAISGGASKGTYEAGLIWGLIKVMRQVEEAEDWSMGGEPRSIEIVSIAGTSAGGINSLLAALTWSVNPESEGGFTNRIDDNIFRDVWLSVDVNQLLPSDPESDQYLTDDALLARKVLVSAADEVRKKWQQPGTFRPGLRLPLGVTVTRVRPETMVIGGVTVHNQRSYIPFELRTQADGSAGFFFDPNDYPTLTDPAMILMPWPANGLPFSVSNQQVVDALLSTSAFPIGFGRKRLQYCRVKDFSTDEDSTSSPLEEADVANQNKLVCPEGYKLAEAEFADGGLFDNLPIGLARLLSESSTLNKKKQVPTRYLYLDPDRQRYEIRVSSDKTACEGENPPEACREMTFNFASEAAVLGGAIGTARKYELFRELTSPNWRLNLSQLSRKMADIIDAEKGAVNCDAALPYFDGQLNCSDRLRYTGRLLELAHSYRIAPIIRPMSAQALLKEDIAIKCRPPSSSIEQGFVSECNVDVPRLRKHLADALVGLSTKVAPENENFINDIRRSALSVDSDRMIMVSSRGGPITGLLLGAFGAFIDYKFREFDYYVGVYDAVGIIANNQCQRNFPSRDQQDQFLTCRDQLSEELYNILGVADNPKSRYLYALMAKREFGKEGGLRFAYDPMPPEDRDIRIIFEGLNKSVLADNKDQDELAGWLSTELGFFEYLKAEKFEPTPPPESGRSLLALFKDDPARRGESLLTLIMDDPEYWTNELVKRATDRMIFLEKQADAIYRAREPDPEKRESANAGLVGAGALVLRTATFKYPKFSFAPSTAPEAWLWRNLIPYEAAFDLAEGDILLFWQPTWNFNRINAGIRFGLGFVGGLFKSSEDKTRENYGTVGLDLTRNMNTAIFSGFGITPAVYHDWSEPDVGEQTTFGVDVHAYLLKNRVRLSLGARDVINDAGNTIFLTFGIADLPGLIYWLSR